MTTTDLAKMLESLGVKTNPVPVAKPTQNGSKPKATPARKVEVPKPAPTSGPSELVVDRNLGEAAATFGVASITRWGNNSKKGAYRKGGVGIKATELEYVIDRLIDIHRSIETEAEAARQAAA